jgi:ABC-type Zn2+ transport system substrate-binding protein/surface adhesin
MPFLLKRISELKNVNLGNIIDFNATFFNGDYFLSVHVDEKEKSDSNFLAWSKINSNDQKIYIPNSSLNKKYSLRNINSKLVKKTEIVAAGGDIYVFFLLDTKEKDLIIKKVDAMSVSSIEKKIEPIQNDKKEKEKEEQKDSSEAKQEKDNKKSDPENNLNDLSDESDNHKKKKKR